MYFFKQCIFLFIVTRNCFLEALRYPLSMKCYSTFCKTLNPSCIYSVRNCRVDFYALDFEMCIPWLLFLFCERDGQCSCHTAIVYSCILPRSCIPVSRFALIRFRPLLGMRARTCASIRTNCGAAASSIFRRWLYRVAVPSM